MACEHGQSSFRSSDHQKSMDTLTDYVDFSQNSLWAAVGCIFFNPIFWNTAARLEFNHKTLTRLAGGSPYAGCYALAVTIFALGIFRDHLYQLALQDQPKWDILDNEAVQFAAVGLFAVGSVLVLTSMWVLGVTGTYLGDYFGILMDEKVESFPFNVTDDPMYYGSTMNFVATALWYKSPAGLLISALVLVVYKVALMFEGPFTTEIYAARERRRAEGKEDKKSQ